MCDVCEHSWQTCATWSILNQVKYFKPLLLGDCFQAVGWSHPWTRIGPHKVNVLILLSGGSARTPTQASDHADWYRSKHCDCICCMLTKRMLVLKTVGVRRSTVTYFYSLSMKAYKDKIVIQVITCFLYILYLVWFNTFSVGFSDSLVLPQQVKTPSARYLAMVEKELGERNFGFDSLEVQIEAHHGGESDITAGSCQFTWGPYHFSDAPLFRPLRLLRRQSSPRSPHTTERSEQWSVGEMIWTRSELSAVYLKHLSRMPPEFVVAGDDVKRSTGGSITTSNSK